MIPEIFVIVSTVCYPVLIDANLERVCRQSIQITTTTPVAKEGQTVKRLCDFVGHRWADYDQYGHPDNVTIWTPEFENVGTVGDIHICIYCGKKRRRIYQEPIKRWEDLP